MQRQSAVVRTVAAHLFALKLIWKICKKRIILEFLDQILLQFQNLVYSCVVIQVILELAGKRKPFAQVVCLLWIILLFHTAISLFDDYFQNIVLPVTNVSLYEGIGQLLYEKAGNVDLACFENSEFYNQYVMAVRQAQIRIPKALHNLCAIAAGLAAVVGAFFLIFRIDHPALGFIIFPILGNFVFNAILNTRIFRMDRESVVFQRIADYVNRTFHLADYAKELRISNVFRLLKEKYRSSVDRQCQVIDRYAMKNMILFWLFQYFTFTLLYEGAMIYAGYRVLVTGTMIFSQMAVFQQIMRSNAWTLLRFAENVMSSVKDSLYLEQIRDFLSYEADIPENADGILPSGEITTIEFSHVWFGYKKEQWVLKDVSFTVSMGQSVAIVGYNGAGKSTLIKLLLRFYDPDRGTILVNGTDIRAYRLRVYRELFAAAFQDGKIFADTVQENILMGRHRSPGEDHERVWQALRLAGMADEVASWPKKEQTILTREFSEEGLMLSGGQYQKIVAARAFARDTPAAVFDEPSSALDPLAEYELFTNIRKYGTDRILFFISHRLSSVRSADIVFFMENGRITERGTHEELMNRKGTYAALYQIQAENYLAKADTDRGKHLSGYWKGGVCDEE